MFPHAPSGERREGHPWRRSPCRSRPQHSYDEFVARLTALSNALAGPNNGQPGARTMNQLESMAGRTCLITGATSGIGRAAAVALGSRGANLILVGRREQLGARVVAHIRRLGGGGKTWFLQADLSDQQAGPGVGGDHRSRSSADRRADQQRRGEVQHLSANLGWHRTHVRHQSPRPLPPDRAVAGEPGAGRLRAGHHSGFRRPPRYRGWRRLVLRAGELRPETRLWEVEAGQHRVCL